MITKSVNFGNKDGLNILVMSGVHGNETHAVSAVYELSKTLNCDSLYDKIDTITFIYNFNEYGLEQDTRDNNYEKEISKNCNRLFPKEYKTSKELKEYIENLDINYDLILDVHNSPCCIPCVLIDYDENAYRLLNNLKGIDLYPLIRTTQIGTIKKYFNKLGWSAYTVELPQMGAYGNIEESKRLLEQFINVVINNLYKAEQTDIRITQNIITEPIYTHIDNGIIRYARKEIVGDYKAGEIIADVENMNDDYFETIKAPYDGVLYDVDDNLYSYAGKELGIYGIDLRRMLNA